MLLVPCSPRSASGRRYRLVPLLARAERVGELLEGRAQELGLGPEVGGEEAVGAADGDEGGLEGVLEGLSGAGGGGVGVLDTGELEEALDGGGGDEACTTGGGDELSCTALAGGFVLLNFLAMRENVVCTYTDGDGTAFAALLAGQGVGGTEVGTPVAATDGDDAELGDDDGGADGGGHLLGGLDAETDVALGVANDDDGLEARALTGTGLLLDGLDL